MLDQGTGVELLLKRQQLGRRGHQPGVAQHCGKSSLVVPARPRSARRADSVAAKIANRKSVSAADSSQQKLHGATRDQINRSTARKWIAGESYPLGRNPSTAVPRHGSGEQHGTRRMAK
jgi:hypothetical protein